MKITIESTEMIVELMARGVSIPARLWIGKTERGIDIQVLVTRIAVAADQDTTQFDRELLETEAPQNLDNYERAFPLRLIL